MESDARTGFIGRKRPDVEARKTLVDTLNVKKTLRQPRYAACDYQVWFPETRQPQDQGDKKVAGSSDVDMEKVKESPPPGIQNAEVALIGRVSEGDHVCMRDGDGMHTWQWHALC